jgi:ABC-type bacteriocin/lantibiotic exporter with double-glycine peptidase domain
MAEKHTSIPSSLRKFFAVLKPDKKDLSAIYMFAILAGLIQLSLPLGIQTIINFVMAGSVSTSIVVLNILVVLGTFFNGLLQVRQLEIIEKLKQKIFLRYAFEFSNRLPGINVEKLDNDHLPELANRFFDTISLQKGVEKILLDLPAALIQVLFGILLLSFYHPVFIAFGVLLIVIVFLILRYTSPRGLDHAMEASGYKYRVAAWLQETARVVKTFKYAKETNLQVHKTDAEVSGYLEARTKYFRILLVQFWSLISFKIIITAAMLILGSLLLVNQQINVGQFIAADIVIIAIINSVEKLIISLDKVYDTLVSVEKLGIITEAEKEISGSLPFPGNNKGAAIEFSGVSFAYPSGKTVLNNINCSIRPGEMVLVNGQSGSGKSTLLRLLTGSFTGYRGNILIDGIPLGNYDVNSLRNQTGVLLNSQDIFHGSLLENITLGNNAITTGNITELADLTGFSEFIRSHKEGLDTRLDPFGNRLPKQIRQQILLMRVLLGNHRLILLEEPFAYLSPEIRERYFSLIRSKQSGTILISSEDGNLSSVCDKTIHLEAGSITNIP